MRECKKRDTSNMKRERERGTNREIMNWVSLRTKREKKRLIRKPDQVGPGLPLLGSLGSSCRDCLFVMAMAVIWPGFVVGLLAGVAGREGDLVPF